MTIMEEVSASQLPNKCSVRELFAACYSEYGAAVRARAVCSKEAASADKRKSIGSLNQTFYGGRIPSYSSHQARSDCYQSAVARLEETYQARMQCVDENRNDALTRLQVIADAFALLPDEHAIASVDQAIEQLKEVFLNPKTRVSFMLYEQIESSSAIPSMPRPMPRPRRYV